MATHLSQAHSGHDSNVDLSLLASRGDFPQSHCFSTPCIILGLPCLESYNPMVDLQTRSIKFSLICFRSLINSLHWGSNALLNRPSTSNFDVYSYSNYNFHFGSWCWPTRATTFSSIADTTFDSMVSTTIFTSKSNDVYGSTNDSKAIHAYEILITQLLTNITLSGFHNRSTSK